MAMEVASQPFLSATQDEPDIMDIDIDMDVDIEALGDEDGLEVLLSLSPPWIAPPSSHFFQEGEADATPSAFHTSAATGNTLIPAIYNEDPLDELQPDRVHIRGVDDFHTSDIITFANDHFPAHDPLHIQWIDDTSANIVYPSSTIAQQALISFSQASITIDDVTNSPFEPRSAKTLSTRPASTLQIRVAKMGDRKKKNAKDASRYYLLHPDQDPRERMRKEFEASGRIRRGGDHGDYQRRRYDDREHRRRRDNDAANGGDTNGDFSASMYDDAPPAAEATESATARGRDLFARTSGRRHRNRSASPGRSVTNSDSLYASDGDEDAQNRRRAQNNRFRDRSPPPRYTMRDPHPFPANNASKELFPAAEDKTKKVDGEGTLHSDKIELFPSSTTSRNDANNATARRMKADLLSSPRSQNHRRSNAMDAANDEDLAERFGRKSLSELPKPGRNAGKELLPDPGLNIRGAAMDQGISIKGSGGLSIKGAAANTRELFPSLYQKGGNEGKELFSDKIRERGRRIRADDFH
jgi:hypothetical protein